MAHVARQLSVSLRRCVRPAAAASAGWIASGAVSSRLAARALAPRALWRSVTTTAARAAAPAIQPELGLTDEQLEFFDTNGWLEIPDFWSRERCAELMERANAIVDEFEPEHVSVFTTKEQERSSDDFFLTSGDKVRCFFEEMAFDEAGELKVDKNKSINKIGHAMHDLEPVFQQATYTPRLAAICASLGYARPTLVQSMYIFKQPGIGGEVGAHQDGTFLYTEPQSCTGFWWALEDCTLDNGCLWAVPGSHKMGVNRWFRRADAPDTGTMFEPAEETPLPTEGAVPLKTKAGTLVLLHHALVHFSNANLSPISRHAYSVHLVEGGKDVKYPAENWLQRPGGSFHTFPEFQDATPAAEGPAAASSSA